MTSKPSCAPFRFRRVFLKVWIVGLLFGTLGGASLNTVFAQSVETKKSEKPKMQNDGQAQNLATVIFLPFEDKTGSKNYAYLSESLKEAIEKAMAENFEFKSLSMENLQAALAKIPIPVRTAKDSDTTWKNKQLDYIKSLLKELNGDIIVFGSYRTINIQNEVIITPNIYLALIDQVETIEDTTNPLDNTLFQATKKVGENLVAHIQKAMSDEKKAKQNKEIDTNDSVAEAQTAEKITLTRESAESFINFDRKKWTLVLNSGVSAFTISELGGLLGSPSINVSSQFWPGGPLQISINAFYNIMGSNYGLIPMVGIKANSKRVLWYLEIGPGFSYANTSINYTISGADYNYTLNRLYVLASAATGLEFLLGSNFLLGLRLSYAFNYPVSLDNSDLPGANGDHLVNAQISMGMAF